MKAIFVVFLAVCAYGQAASTGLKKVTDREISYVTADQEVHRVGYVYNGEGMMWNEAELACIEAGYKNLMTIKNAGAQEAVEYVMAVFGISSGYPWLGLHRAKTSDVWAWADGTALGTYKNWYSTPGSTVVGGARVYTNTVAYFGQWYVAGGLTTTSNYGLCED